MNTEQLIDQVNEATEEEILSFDFDPLFTRLRELEESEDLLRMQLVACGVIALSNTRDSAKVQRIMKPEYMSASASDVIDAVDKQMDYREALDQLEHRFNDVKTALKVEQSLNNKSEGEVKKPLYVVLATWRDGSMEGVLFSDKGLAEDALKESTCESTVLGSFFYQEYVVDGCWAIEIVELKV